MSTKTDVMAIRLIGEEVVRLLSLPEERLDVEAVVGLKLIADLAQWRGKVYGVELPKPSCRSSSARH